MVTGLSGEPNIAESIKFQALKRFHDASQSTTCAIIVSKF